MQKKGIIFILRITSMLVLLLTAIPAAAQEPGFIAMTDPLPPFNYEHDGKIIGITHDILREIMDMADVPLDSVRMVPWARGMEDTQRKAGRILFSVARTDEREELFKWVGPIHRLRLGLIGPIDDGPSPSAMIKEAANFVACAVRNSAPHKLLIAAGFPTGKLTLVPSPNLCLQMLKKGRVDLFAHSDLATALFMAQEQMIASEYRLVHLLKEVELYIAFSPMTDDATIEKLNKALEELKTSGDDGSSRYQEIINVYLPNGLIAAF